MSEPTQQDLIAVDRKQQMAQQAQVLVRRMNHVAAKLDAELNLACEGFEPLGADILTSLLASWAVRHGLRCEKIVNDFREKHTRARRFEKAQSAAAAGTDVIPDAVMPAEERKALEALGVRFSAEETNAAGVETDNVVRISTANPAEAPSDVAPDAAPALIVPA